MNYLTALPPKVRSILYIAFTVATLVLQTTEVGFSSAGRTDPTWLVVGLKVVSYLGVALGLVAASNTQVKPTEPVPTTQVVLNDSGVDPVAVAQALKHIQARDAHGRFVADAEDE